MTFTSIVRQSVGASSRRANAPAAAAVRALHQSSALRSTKPPGSLEPTHESRTSPAQPGTRPQHPGYTSADTPVSDAHPGTIPGAKGAGQPSSQSRLGSTVSNPHPSVNEMAEGAKIGGEDAITPEERNVKNWGPNTRSSQFNPEEGRRNPVRDGGSNEGGFDTKGNSKT